MTGSKKKPILFIGLIVFLAMTVCGMIADLAFLKTGGKVTLISAGIGLLILAGCSAIDAVKRRSAEKKAMYENDPSLRSQFDMPAEQRFLRHSDNGYSTGFEDGADAPYDSDGFDDYPLEEQQDAFDEAFDSAQNSPSSFLRRRAAELRASRGGSVQEPVSDDTFVIQDGYSDNSFDSSPDYAAQDAEPTADEFEDEIQEEVPAPSRFFNRRANPVQEDFEQEQTAPQYAPQYAPQPEQYAQQYAPQPEQPAPRYAPQINQPAAEPIPQPVVAYYAQPEQPAEQPQNFEPVTLPTVDVPVQPATERNPDGGQTLESFFDSMSDDDILYRDCVEIWAADAKPSVLRLMKLVESIDDKKKQALFGRDVEYINAMIDRIYCFTRLDYVDQLLEIKKYNFSALVKECLKRFSPFFMEKRLGLLWKGLDMDVMTDRTWFVFALTQVIFNCVEFTPEGGKIAISAKRNGDYIDLMIDDNGKGISPDELPCAFIAGYMGDDAPGAYVADEGADGAPEEAGRRTGMGLFIAQSVLRKMGGDAFIESNYGKGTRVTLRVPAMKEGK